MGAFMKRIAILFLTSLCLLSLGCKRVSVQIEGDDPLRFTVPLFVVFQALKFTDDDVLEIDDLGGVDEEIPLKAIAEAIRNGGDQMKLDYREGGSHITAEKIDHVFHIQMEDAESEERVQLRLPENLMTAIATAEDGQLNQRKIKRALKKFSGVLLEVESPHERIRIILR